MSGGFPPLNTNQDKHLRCLGRPLAAFLILSQAPHCITYTHDFAGADA
jgi:hypothetical protein